MVYKHENHIKMIGTHQCLCCNKSGVTCIHTKGHLVNNLASTSRTKCGGNTQNETWRNIMKISKNMHKNCKENNLCLRLFLKVFSDGELLIAMGREFHICGAAMESV